MNTPAQGRAQHGLHRRATRLYYKDPSMRKRLALLLTLLVLATAGRAQTPYLHAPSVDTYAKHDPNGITILPTGRYLKPAGRHLPMAKWPHGLALSADGRRVFVASDGVGQIVTDWNGPSPVV